MRGVTNSDLLLACHAVSLLQFLNCEALEEFNMRPEILTCRAVQKPGVVKAL